MCVRAYVTTERPRVCRTAKISEHEDCMVQLISSWQNFNNSSIQQVRKKPFI